MIRTGRAVTAILAAGAVMALSACGATDRTAATVDGVSISGDDFEALGRAFLAQPDPAGGENVPDDRLSGEVARSLLGQVITGQLIESFLTARDAMPTAEDLAAAPVEDWQADLPADILRPLQLSVIAPQAVGSAAADDAAAAYAAPAAESGVLCPRLILVPTEAEAQDVVTELEGGADFAALATERSTDPSAASGGILSDPNDPAAAQCLDAAALPPGSADGEAALLLSPGEWSPPTEVPLQDGSTAWIVLFARPFDEVGDEVGRVLAGDLITEYVQSAEVEVDPAYGRWDPEQFAVVSL